jgi:hypothetical protein
MRALTAIVAIMLPFAAAAQEQPSTAPRSKLRIAGDHGWLTPEDRNSYCFWGGELYSIGAAFCSRQQTLTTCTEVAGRRPTWVSKETTSSATAIRR